MGYSLKIMTDTRVREISNGEVKNYGRYNFRFNQPRPTKGGLFCQSIFGPITPFTCECGLINRYPLDKSDVYCKVCQVPFLPSSSRMERFGHIELNTYFINPVGMEVVASILGINEKLLYSLAIGEATCSLVQSSKGKLLDNNGEPYTISINSDGNINSVFDLVKEMKKVGIDGDISMMQNYSVPGKTYFNKGYNLYDFFNSTILVTPSGTRDINKVGDRTVYSEINIIYTRLLRESLRIKQVSEENDTVISKFDKIEIIRFESQIIQKLINAMMLEGINYGKIKIAPVIENLKGKEGLIRQNLLGKRIDFSGRTVIVSGPDLPIDTISIPSDMLYELLKPHLIHKLIVSLKGSNPHLSNVIAIQKSIILYKEKSELVLNLIEIISKEIKILVNRAPSLHRYSAMTFNVRVNYNKCIYFPPMACSPFNADFDGDTLGIFLILGDDAKEEASRLTDYTQNLMSSANFEKPNASLSHELVVGSYLLSNVEGV